VNLTDFNILAANFGQSGIFSQGDFNYSGTVDLVDFNILASRFGTSIGPDGSIERTSDDPLPSLPFGTKTGGSSLLGGKSGGGTDEEQEALV
jgi:hypothetical protein